jgi:U3 small nucleolar RNA-associated protein 7
VQAVGEGVKNLAFDLKLPLGPYKLALDRSGRHAALAGASGHLALMDWPRYHLMCETQVKETTHDVCILHNEQFFAAAQKKYVYIYDRTGAEVHCCQEHVEPLALDFLPYHFLLASCGKPGTLRKYLVILSSPYA